VLILQHTQDKIRNMENMLENFVGLWVDKNANLLLIEPWKTDVVKVFFASGKTKAPIERSFMEQKPTTDVLGEFNKGLGELIVQFGKPYYGPQLHLKYEVTNIYEGKASLEPSHALVGSASKEKKEWLKWLEPLEDYVFIGDKDKIKETLSLYQT
jgi:hypothetical protein